MVPEGKVPPWYHEPSGELHSSIGVLLLGGRSKDEIADYGRWHILRHLLANGGMLRYADKREKGYVARELGLSQKSCDAFLQRLVVCGVLEATSWAEGSIVVPSIFDDYSKYNERCRTNRQNKLKGATNSDESCNES